MTHSQLLLRLGLLPMPKRASTFDAVLRAVALSGMCKEASAAWALRFARLSPAARARLGQTLRPQTRSTMGKALGEGTEKAWFPSATIRDGKAMDSATSVWFDRPGMPKDLPFGKRVTRGGVSRIDDRATPAETVGLMRDNPQWFAPVWGEHARGFTAPLLRPVNANPELGLPWTRDAILDPITNYAGRYTRRYGAVPPEMLAAVRANISAHWPLRDTGMSRSSHPMRRFWKDLKRPPQDVSRGPEVSPRPPYNLPYPIVPARDGRQWVMTDVGGLDRTGGKLHNFMYYPAEKRYVVSDPMWRPFDPSLSGGF